MKTINIQSVSDLITNSSTEVFVVYSKSNVKDIKNLVNSILSLLDPSKTFDDYFTIEMLINYEDLFMVFDRYSEDDEFYSDFPEFEKYNGLSYDEGQKYVESIPAERVEEIFDWYNNDAYDRLYSEYEGFIVNAKDENDPVARKVAKVINSIDNIFDIDYSSEY